MSPDSQPVSRGRYVWAWVVLAFVGALLLMSWTPTYVEGDDAVSIAHHALGRDANVQPAYAAYHSGMDAVLGLLPSREPVLRVTAFALSGCAALVFVLLLLQLVAETLSLRLKPLVVLLVLLAAPELVYLGTSYSPSLVGMATVLAAHWWLRHALRRAGEGTGVLTGLAPGLLLGVGVACRWDVGVYAPIIVADALLLRTRWGAVPSSTMPVVRTCVGLAVASLASFLVVVGLAEISPMNVLKAASSAGGTGSQAAGMMLKLVTIVGGSQALLTPALILLGLLGLGRLDWQLRTVVVLHAVGMLAFTFVLDWSIPKWWMPLLPGLFLAVVAGAVRLIEGTHRRSVVIAVAAVLLLPWFVGVRVQMGESQWGPGHELRSAIEPAGWQGLAPFRAGTAFPTPEGPRALWGFGGALLGERRSLTRSLDSDRRNLVDKAIATDAPIVVIQGSTGYVVADLARRGYSTLDPAVQSRQGPLESRRRFVHPDGGYVDVLKTGSPSAWANRDLSWLEAAAGRTTAYLIGYSSAIATVFDGQSDSVDILGPETARLSF